MNQNGGARVVPTRLDAPVPPTQSITILGSTGSIGCQSLEVARQEGYRVVALAAGRNVSLLARQIVEFKPSYVSVIDESAKQALMAHLAADTPDGFTNPCIVTGRKGALLVATHPEADTVVAAITGFAGLEPVLGAASAGKKIALANKESLVVAGDEVKRLASRSGAWILPVDSEHSAIWQCSLASPEGSVSRIVLTCSGGPFHGLSRNQLSGVTVAEALAHPTWTMGDKITIDSATLMNKAFEVLEGCHLFDMEHRTIDVVVHPQSIVHSFVEFQDGALMAQLGPPDMTIPIRFALTFPKRSDKKTLKPYDLLSGEGTSWSFAPVREDVFPSIRMAREAYDRGGLMPLVLNAANEAAVSRFLSKDIPLTRIFDLIRRALSHFNHMAAIKAPSFDDMMSAHLRVMRHVMDDRFGANI